MLNKKRIVVLIATLLVVATALSLVGCGSGGDPKSVVNAFFDSIDKQDAKKFLNCFEKETRDTMLEDTDEDQIKELLQYMDDALVDQYGEKWRKQVKVGKSEKGDTEDGITTYEVTVTMKNADGEEEEDTVPVRKIKGKFYIDENGLGGMM